MREVAQALAQDQGERNVLVLGMIVIIRTFLSISLEVEIDGKWPWQRPTEK